MLTPFPSASSSHHLQWLLLHSNLARPGDVGARWLRLQPLLPLALPCTDDNCSPVRSCGRGVMTWHRRWRRGRRRARPTCLIRTPCQTCPAWLAASAPTRSAAPHPGGPPVSAAAALRHPQSAATARCATGAARCDGRPRCCASAWKFRPLQANLRESSVPKGGGLPKAYVHVGTCY